jgi:mannose-6-phosphate isomerase-like protein (cupin superfamily)
MKLIEKGQNLSHSQWSTQKLQHDTKRIWKVVDSLTTMEPYLTKHRLRENDKFLMQNTILKTIEVIMVTNF